MRLTLLQRRLLSAGFSISYINGLESMMQECIQMFVEAIKNKCADGNGSAVIDFARLFANLTFVSTLTQIFFRSS